jgi:putative ABC transport system substrate-binding protein
MQATRTIPIVMASSSDPVRGGVVASLARPGGNVTGFSTLRTELEGKRLELFKQTVPKDQRAAAQA